MEKENKRIRDDAIQEFNEAVRSLIAFVRKRDPRVQNNQKSEAERQKALKEAAAAQAARSRAAQQAKLQQGVDAVPEWARSRTKDVHEGGFSSESEIEEHEYECVVCDKTFNLYRKAPYAEYFEFIEPLEPIALKDAKPFDCSRTALRHPKETKGQDYAVTTEASACCDGGDCC